MTDLSARTSRIGGSDLLAILSCGCGVCAALSTTEAPYRTAWDVWARITGKVPVETWDQTESQRLGHTLEPLVIAAASRALGAEITSPPPAIDGYRVGHADGLAQAFGVEIKVQTAFGTAHPLAWELQCRWYMMLYQRPIWFLVACHVPAQVPCHAFSDPVSACRLEYSQFHREESLEQHVADLVGAWWGRHVVSGVEPPRTGARSLRSIPRPPGPARATPLRTDPPEGMALLVEQYADARRRISEATMEADHLASQIQDIIGSDAGYRVGPYVVSLERGTQRRVSFEKLKTEYPSVYQAVSEEAPRSRLNVRKREK